MPFRRESDYEPLTRPRQIAAAEGEVLNNRWLPPVQPVVEPEPTKTRDEPIFPDEPTFPETLEGAAQEKSKPDGENWSTRNGHGLTFVALFLYTAIAYFRPYELWPVLSWTIWLPYWMAIGMLAIFIPSQFVTEGSVTARPREINVALLLGLIAIISIPQAISPVMAWETFYTLFAKTIVVFIIMVNVLRTEKRLRWMVILGLIAGIAMSYSALTDYWAGRASPYGDRAAVAISNMFGEPNSLALHLVIMIPLAVAFFMSTPNVLKKLTYLAGIVVMIGGIFATSSRGGFLGLAAAGFVLAWKLGRRNRLAVTGLLIVVVLASMVLAPGGYGLRIASIFDSSLDPVGSSSARQALLTRSIWVALTRPFLGVGIGNLRIVLIHDQVSHNAYTQVAGEMGLIAFALYVAFMVIPYRRLRLIERETLREEHHSRYYYLSVGLQASIVGYMVSSFFLSVAYEWYVYFLVAYAVSFRRLYVRDSMAIKDQGVS
jgi:uncharacterized membrane protein YwzB